MAKGGKYRKHIFICVNEREEDNPKGSCARCGGKDIRLEFVKMINANGLKGKVRANKSGCLDACELGSAVVIYPDNFWYTRVKVDDVKEIFERSVLNNKRVKRLIADKETWMELKSIRDRKKAS